MAYLLTGPTSWSSPLHHHNHLPEGVIPVGCPGRGSEEVKLLYLAVCAKVSGQSLPSDMGRDVTYGDTEPTGAPIFRLQPEMLGRYVVRRKFSCLVFCRKQDIPCRKTFMTEVLAWDACIPQQLLKRFLLQPHQPLGLQVRNDQREDPGRELFY